MIQQHNAKRLRAGIAATALLALAITVARPGELAASNGAAQPVAGVMASIELAVGQAYLGTLQFASDMRSLYSVYQLQSAPETMIARAASPIPNEEAQLISCEIFRQIPTQKKKSRT